MNTSTKNTNAEDFEEGMLAAGNSVRKIMPDPNSILDLFHRGLPLLKQHSQKGEAV